MEWRLVITRGDVYWCMAVDEALLELRIANCIPNTLRLYVIEPSAVTIGYFQRVRDAVNLDYLLRNNIGFTRRITGGGSVYHDSSGEIVYSVVAPVYDIAVDVMESYRVICNGVVYAIRELGLEAMYKPVNDILVNGKKVSGSAQTRRRGYLLQHGTLMYDTDLDKLANSLKAPREKLRSHGVTSIRERVTTLSLELGYKLDYRRVLEALINGFTNALHIEFYRDKLSKEELELANKLYNKYKSREWMYRR